MKLGEVRKLWIAGPAGRLEAALRVAGRPLAGAVIAHPHPLHGGTLHNPVVFHADRELHRAGMTTLRFNFRGVGTSQGEHDNGRGELEDVAAAAAWLRGLTAGAPLLAVGYSFGALCAIRHALTSPVVEGVIAVGLPTRIYPIGEVAELRRPLVVVQGGDDELGSPDEVRELLAGADPPGELRVVDGADHLFTGCARKVAEQISAAAVAMLGL